MGTISNDGHGCAVTDQCNVEVPHIFHDMVDNVTCKIGHTGKGTQQNNPALPYLICPQDVIEKAHHVLGGPCLHVPTPTSPLPTSDEEVEVEVEVDEEDVTAGAIRSV